MKLLVTAAMALLYSMAAPAQLRVASASGQNHFMSHQGLIHDRAERARHEVEARNRGIDNMKRDLAKHVQEKPTTSFAKLEQESSRTYNLTQSYFERVKRFFSLQVIHLKSKWNKLSGKIASTPSFFSQVKPLLLPDFPDSGINVKEFGTGPAPEVHFSSKVNLTTLSSPADSIHWDFGDNSTLDVPILLSNSFGEIVHVYTEAGHYNVQMVIKNGATVVTTLTGEAETQEHDEPIPNFTLTVTGTAAPFSFHGASLATDPAGAGPYMVVWYVDGVVVCQTTNCDGTIATAGNHVVSVDITDVDNITTSASTKVNLNGTTNPVGPVPVLIASTRIGFAPLTVEFDGSHSFSPTGVPITQYYWDFNEKDKALGNEPFTPKAERTFTRPGTYWVYLEADYADGSYNYVLVPIYVLELSPQSSQIVAFEYAPLEVNFDWKVNSIRSAAHDTGLYWDFGDGSTYVGRYPDHTYAAAGTYTVSLRAIDVRGNSFTTTKSITVGATVDVPNAVASLSSYSTPVFQNVTFDASGSTDSAGQPLTYRWTFADDGTQITTTNASVTHSFSQRGVVPFELVVTNSRGLSQSTAYYLQVTDGPALNASMTFDPKAGPGPQMTVNFDGSLSQSLDGKPLFHDWVWNGYSLSNDEKFSHSFAVGDNYFVHFVSDSLGNQAILGDHLVVYTAGTVPPGNLPPVPVITLYPDLTNKLLAFSCSSSTDPDGSVVGCEWKLNGVRVSDGNFVPSQPMIDGQVNTVELTVVDNWGATATTYAQVDLTPGGAPTVTDFKVEPAAPVINENVVFSADMSSVAGGTIKKFEWNFGDSTSGFGMIANHTYTATGTYTVTLTTTDAGNVARTVTKSVTVTKDYPPAQIKVTATDASLSGHVSDGNTYTTRGFPETVRFSVATAGATHGEIDYADWTIEGSSYGSNVFLGETLGRNVEYTFNQPGTYTVSVQAGISGYFGDGAYTEITVVVPEDSTCQKSEEETMCLRLANNLQGILPMSASEWIVTNSLGASFSTSSTDLVKNWIYLQALDGSENRIDISDITTISGTQLSINKNGIVNKNVDLTRSYKLVVKTRSTSGTELIGEWPMLAFGSAVVNITSVEDYTAFELVNTENRLQTFFYMGEERADHLQDIPAGNYAVTIFTDESSVSYPVSLQPWQTTTLSASAPVSTRNHKNMARIEPWKNWQRGEQKRTSAVQAKDNENLPSWTNSLCGESSPFEASPSRIIDAGASITMPFASYSPTAQSAFTQVPNSKENKLHLSCKVSSPALLYSQNKWKYKEGPQRCSGDSTPHPYWKDYLKSLKHETDPIIITYQIKDAWDGRLELGHISTSARNIMLSNGLEIDQLSSHNGLGVDDGGDWGQRVDYELTIPRDFSKPEISWNIQSSQDSGQDSFYQVECDIVASDNSPRIARIQTAMSGSAAHTSAQNAALSLQKGFGYFPLQYDDRATAAISQKSDVAKANYEIQIQPNGRSDITWQGVELVFSYAEQSFTKVYPLTDAGTTDSATGVYINKILVDTADLKNKFNWVQGKAFVTVQFTPIGKVTTDGDFRGSASTKRMIALFDAQTVHDQQFSQICQNGFYPTQVSTFARGDMLSVMMKGATESLGLKCGDISTPFGGTFQLSSTWKHNGHNDGVNSVMRPLADASIQDSYDYSTRLSDVAEYTTFVNGAATAAADSTARGQVYNFCHGGPSILAPCTPSTVATDLDQDMIIEICQWYASPTGVAPTGCPTADMTKIARFSQWVELNSDGWRRLIQDTSARVFVSSGRWNPSAIVTANGWQYDALVSGLWPDGRQIWKVGDLGGTTLFTNERAVQIDGPFSTCSFLKPTFSDSQSFSDSLSIMTGWK